MTSTSLWDVQAGIYTCLTQNTALTGLLAAGAAGIFDAVPQDAAFPYIVLGPMAALPFDTQTTQGNDITFTLNSFSRQRGMKEIRSIMAAIAAVLHEGDFTVANHSLTLCREVSADSYLAADAVTRRGVQKFRLVTEPV